MGRSELKTEKDWLRKVRKTDPKKWEGLTLNMEGLSQKREGPIQKQVGLTPKWEGLASKKMRRSESKNKKGWPRKVGRNGSKNGKVWL